MDANELRLGNLVAVNHGTDLISKVVSIDEGMISVMFDRQDDLVDGTICHPTILIPIQLTEKWLKRCGFYYSPNELMEKTDCLFGLEYDSESKTWNILMLRDNYYLRSISELHDFQNFYKYFTGQELEIKWT